jgi:hypothetical protein
MKKIILIVYVAVLLVPVTTASGELITLKNGKAVEGPVLEEKAGWIKVDIEGVGVTYYADEIKAIERGLIGSVYDQGKEVLLNHAMAFWSKEDNGLIVLLFREKAAADTDHAFSISIYFNNGFDLDHVERYVLAVRELNPGQKGRSFTVSGPRVREDFKKFNYSKDNGTLELHLAGEFAIDGAKSTWNVRLALPVKTRS